jgi:hypothetical protein
VRGHVGETRSFGVIGATSRSHLPFLEYAAQIDLMWQLAERAAPHV